MILNNSSVNKNRNDSESNKKLVKKNPIKKQLINKSHVEKDK